MSKRLNKNRNKKPNKKRANKACGIDVHEGPLVAAIVDRDDVFELKKFDNSAEGHIALAKWLKRSKCRKVGMESTGIYWKAVAHTLIRYGIEVIVSNADDVSRVPGKKMDEADACWIARLTRDGYMPPSNLLDKSDDDFRSIVRLRIKMVRTRTAMKNRVSALLSKAGLRLKTSDKFGKAARAILKEIGDGKPLREIFTASRQKLFGDVTEEALSAIESMIVPSIRKEFKSCLDTIHALDDEIATLEAEISKLINSDKKRTEAYRIISSVPGFADIASPIVMAEIGDKDSFPTAEKFSSYAGLVSSLYQSGEREEEGRIIRKEIHGRPRKRCNKRLKWIFLTAATVIIKLPTNPLIAPLKRFYRRIRNRNRGQHGEKKAKLALAHKLAKIVYHLLKNNEFYVGDEELTKHVFLRRNKNQNLNKDNDKLPKVLPEIVKLLCGNFDVKTTNSCQPT